MSGITDLQRPAGFVRPRFDDGTFEEPLPLEDHVLEHVAQGAARARLVVVGPRGSGLTTTIQWLRERIIDAGVEAFGPGRIATDGATACGALDRGEAVLLLDLSMDVRDAEWKTKLGLLADARRRDWRLVAVAHEHPGHAKAVQLAPWTWDDLIELLGDPGYREHRGRILSALRALPDGAQLISRPRTARWLADAALALGPDEPATLARLYANVLDTLSPSTLEALRRLSPGDYGTEGFLRAISCLEHYDAEEASALFELDRDLACFLSTPERRRALNLPYNLLTVIETAKSRLALPGLQHLLQAGQCLERVAQDDPPDEIAPSWFPYLRELVTEPVKARLRGWLEDVNVARTRDGQAATILWACGETPPFDSTRRAHVVFRAHLEGVALPGVNLSTSLLSDTRLDGARLEGARLEVATIERSCLDGAVLDGADLSRGAVQHSTLRHASLRGARGHHLQVDDCDLRGADLEGARFANAVLTGCELGGANLRRLGFAGGKLVACKLDGAWLEQTELRGALLSHLDLTKALSFAPATLAEATLAVCDLAGVDLDELQAEKSTWRDCDLSEVRLREARLAKVHFDECKLHAAIFDGADLRDAHFGSVHFQAGSSRSGLLIGKPALEGTMTGFYAEGTTDDAWASLDSIRQASFRGADLRGATFFDTNLFRVDFREAKLDEGTRELAREHGAILGD